MLAAYALSRSFNFGCLRRRRCTPPGLLAKNVSGLYFCVALQNSSFQHTHTHMHTHIIVVRTTSSLGETHREDRVTMFIISAVHEAYSSHWVTAFQTVGEEGKDGEDATTTKNTQGIKRELKTVRGQQRESHTWIANYIHGERESFWLKRYKCFCVTVDSL